MSADNIFCWKIRSLHFYVHVRRPAHFHNEVISRVMHLRVCPCHVIKSSYDYIFAGILALALLNMTSDACADDRKFGGHAKYQYTVTDFRDNDLNSLFGMDPTHDHAIDLRLKAENHTQFWDSAIHYELLGVSGDTITNRRQLSMLGTFNQTSTSELPNDDRRLLDLTSDISDTNRAVAVQRLDRLYLGYTSANWVMRFGRQAISWGNGLVFRPLDFVNPFSPTAIEKDYKTGEDMLYGQLGTGNNSDLQLILLARREPVSGVISGNQGSYAVRQHVRVEGVDLDFVAAHHYAEDLLGIGIATDIGGAVWRLDLSWTDVQSANNIVLFATNLDYSWAWFGKNVYGFVEYFHNGAGVNYEDNYLTVDPALIARIERGELFTLARDYSAMGLRVELTPLMNVYTNLIGNLNDQSRFLQIRGEYNYAQNVQLMVGGNFPSGRYGSEYGGLPTGYPNAYLAPGKSAYLRIAFFF
jgi:hypothetical protein